MPGGVSIDLDGTNWWLINKVFTNWTMIDAQEEIWEIEEVRKMTRRSIRGELP